jgi:anti-sigma B factor antagonist
VGAPDLLLHVETVDQMAIVSAHGEVDLYTAPNLRETLAKVLGSHPCPHVIADLTDVVFIDSVGLGVLVAANLRAEDRGVLFTLVPSSDCRRLLRLTCLDTDFRMASTIDNAIAGTREQTEPRAPRKWRPGR